MGGAGLHAMAYMWRGWVGTGGTCHGSHMERGDVVEVGHVPRLACGSQKITFRSLFLFPSWRNSGFPRNQTQVYFVFSFELIWVTSCSAFPVARFLPPRLVVWPHGLRRCVSVLLPGNKPSILPSGL